MTYWNNFNNLETSYGVIPNGTIAKVKMTINPGGYTDESLNWLGGYATKSPATSAIYLDAEFMVLTGPYAKRKVWTLIGLHSSKGPTWANMGRQFIKAMLNSAKGLSPQDNSEQAAATRQVNSFADLDGIEFVARIDLVIDQYGNQKNELKTPITLEHKDYAAVMGSVASKTQATTHQTFNNNRPSWA